MGPDRVEDEKELDEDAPEWQDAAHEDTWNGFGVEDLFGHLSWDWVGSDWVLDWRLFVAHVGADEDQRGTDSKP